MWENSVDRGRPRVTVWRMRAASWMPKAVNTLSEYVILIDFPLQQWLQERASFSRLYVHACLAKTAFIINPA